MADTKDTAPNCITTPSGGSALRRFIGKVFSPSNASSPSSNRRQRGNCYEALAAEHLTRSGYRLIARQFRTRLGEIDLIAREGSVLCFVEVRSKTSRQFGSAAESVTRQKQARLVRVASSYLRSHPEAQRFGCRFDVVTIDTAADRQHPRIHLIRNAFTAD